MIKCARRSGRGKRTSGGNGDRVGPAKKKMFDWFLLRARNDQSAFIQKKLYCSFIARGCGLYALNRQGSLGRERALRRVLPPSLPPPI